MPNPQVLELALHHPTCCLRGPFMVAYYKCSATAVAASITTFGSSLEQLYVYTTTSTVLQLQKVKIYRYTCPAHDPFS